MMMMIVAGRGAVWRGLRACDHVETMKIRWTRFALERGRRGVLKRRTRLRVTAHVEFEQLEEGTREIARTRENERGRENVGERERTRERERKHRGRGRTDRKKEGKKD